MHWMWESGEEMDAVRSFVLDGAAFGRPGLPEMLPVIEWHGSEGEKEEELLGGGNEGCLDGIDENHWQHCTLDAACFGCSCLRESLILDCKQW